MKKGKKIRALLMCLLATMIFAGCSDFDAKGYTQAYLDAMFQGETDALMSFEEGSRKSELEDQYEEYIAGFSQSLTEGLNLTEPTQVQCILLCEEIFRSARYHVEESEKISGKEYQVTVEFSPSDVFVKWGEYMEENAVDINERLESGEYQGTEEEIREQVLQDIGAESLELLDTAMMDATYGEEEKMVLTIKREENGEFSLDDEEITDFTAKIMRLDEILA